jgi:hypothetical protein
VSAYRDAACLFCDAPSRETCPRCSAPVCEAHGLAGGAWCAICAKELKDDLDVARFTVEVNEVPPDSGALFKGRGNGENLGTLIDHLVGRVRAYFSARRVRRTFDARTHDEIAAWRRTAGVKTRT